MFFEQLKKACDKKKTNPTALVLKLKMSKGNVTRWKSGVIPNGEILNRISEELEVTTDYLLGKEKAPADTGADKEIEMIKELLVNAPPERKAVVVQLLQDNELLAVLETLLNKQQGNP